MGDVQTENLGMDQMAKICKALSHPTRIRILEFLKKEDRCICGDIVDMLPLAQSTVSQHLKILKQSGLVQGEIEGLCTCYCLNKETLERFKDRVNKL
jgi:DNA-binding transcriptional ArsR family regulator